MAEREDDCGHVDYHRVVRHARAVKAAEAMMARLRDWWGRRGGWDNEDRSIMEFRARPTRIQELGDMEFARIGVDVVARPGRDAEDAVREVQEYLADRSRSLGAMAEPIPVPRTLFGLPVVYVDQDGRQVRP